MVSIAAGTCGGKSEEKGLVDHKDLSSTAAGHGMRIEGFLSMLISPFNHRANVLNKALKETYRDSLCSVVVNPAWRPEDSGE